MAETSAHASLAGHPVFGFLRPLPADPSPRGLAARCLRWLGVMVLAGAAVALLETLATLAGVRLAGVGGVVAVLTAVARLAVALAVAVAVGPWLTFAIQAWLRGDARAPLHVLLIGIGAVVFAGLAVLFGFGAVTAAAGSGGWGVPLSLVSLALSVVQLSLGIGVLVNRGKAVAPAPVPPPVTQ